MPHLLAAIDVAGEQPAPAPDDTTEVLQEAGAQSASPLISILAYAPNNATGLERTLQSIAAQGFDDLEILAVDDSGGDVTLGGVLRAALAVDPRLRILRSPWPSGLARIMNAAIARAQGKWLMFLQSGASIPPAALARLRPLLAAREAHIISARVDAARGAADVAPARKLCSLWGKLFRRDFLRARNIGFDPCDPALAAVPLQADALASSIIKSNVPLCSGIRPVCAPPIQSPLVEARTFANLLEYLPIAAGDHAGVCAMLDAAQAAARVLRVRAAMGAAAETGGDLTNICNLLAKKTLFWSALFAVLGRSKP